MKYLIINNIRSTAAVSPLKNHLTATSVNDTPSSTHQIAPISNMQIFGSILNVDGHERISCSINPVNGFAS